MAAKRKRAKTPLGPRGRKGKGRNPNGAGRHTLCTPALTETVAQHVRNGAFDHVAAAAVGIGSRSYARWMARGEAADAALGEGEEPSAEERPYWQFWLVISRARAEARSAVEQVVKKRNPEFWLRNGPGKTKRGSPGWTDPMGEAPVDGETGESLGQQIGEALADKLAHVRGQVLQRKAATVRAQLKRGERPTRKR